MKFIEGAFIAFIAIAGGLTLITWFYNFMLNTTIGNYLTIGLIPLLFYIVYKIATIKENN